MSETTTAEMATCMACGGEVSLEKWAFVHLRRGRLGDGLLSIPRSSGDGGIHFVVAREHFDQRLDEPIYWCRMSCFVRWVSRAAARQLEKPARCWECGAPAAVEVAYEDETTYWCKPCFGSADASADTDVVYRRDPDDDDDDEPYEHYVAYERVPAGDDAEAAP